MDGNISQDTWQLVSSFINDIAQLAITWRFVIKCFSKESIYNFPHFTDWGSSGLEEGSDYSHSLERKLSPEFCIIDHVDNVTCPKITTFRYACVALHSKDIKYLLLFFLANYPSFSVFQLISWSQGVKTEMTCAQQNSW